MIRARWGSGNQGRRRLFSFGIVLALLTLAGVCPGAASALAPGTPSRESSPAAGGQSDWVEQGTAYLTAGEYDRAIDALVRALSMPAESGVSPVQEALVRANLGLAYFLKAEGVRRTDGPDAAVPWYERSAGQIAQFIEEAGSNVLRLMGEYYLTGALVHSRRFREALAVGEQFLARDPQVLIDQGLLPAAARGSMLELVAAAAWAAAERAWFWQRPGLRRRALDYAEQAIDRFPDVALHAYWLTGREAFRRGDRERARVRLGEFVGRLERRPAAELDAEDRQDLTEAKALLGRL